jgi:hypothetical protein
MENIYQAHLYAKGGFYPVYLFVEHYDTGEKETIRVQHKYTMLERRNRADLHNPRVTKAREVSRFAFREVITKTEMPGWNENNGYGILLFDNNSCDYPGEIEPITRNQLAQAAFETYQSYYSEEAMMAVIETARQCAQNHKNVIRAIEVEGAQQQRKTKAKKKRP